METQKNKIIKKKMEQLRSDGRERERTWRRLGWREWKRLGFGTP
jgi:hypothetical protein